MVIIRIHQKQTRYIYLHIYNNTVIPDPDTCQKLIAMFLQYCTEVQIKVCTYVLLSRTQAGPGRAVKQEQEEISRNRVQTFIYLSVNLVPNTKMSSLPQV